MKARIEYSATGTCVVDLDDPDFDTVLENVKASTIDYLVADQENGLAEIEVIVLQEFPEEVNAD
jgi:hypothetical protein